jgi:PAS domain S-box-containing protein
VANERAGILIVEDEIVVAVDIEERLRNIGYDVSGIVTSGGEAIERLGKNSIDLVLMDIGLKGDMDGIETARRIRDKSAVPVIYLTAYSDDKTLARAQVTEPYGYLLKPVNEKELHSTVKMALYKYKMEKKLKEERERFRIVADYTLDWEYWWSPMEGFLYISPSCRTITGYSVEEFLGNPRILERIVHWEDLSAWEKYMGSLGPGTQPETIEFRILTKKGEERWIQGLCFQIIDAEGRNLGVRGSNRDITRLKTTESEVKRLRGILPICASCKKVRDDKGYWFQVEEYIRDHSEAEFSHSLCPECARKVWPEMPDELGM